MRTLVLFRGAPGCGKSTFIKEHGWEPYALSADNIRMMTNGLQLDVNAKTCIDASNDAETWSILFQCLEKRMNKGAFTVIDATNSKTSEMQKYKNLASTYRYRIFCIDMTDLPIEECKKRNAMRPEYKIVPDAAIDKMYARFATQSIPSGIKVLKPNEVDKIFFDLIDLSKYNAVHVIGDIHGCYTAMMSTLNNEIKDEDFYIFCGDYIDRGIENAQVIKFLSEICTKSNVLLLEGNHEKWMWINAHGGVTPSAEFEKKTRPQLEAAKISGSTLRNIYRSLGQCAYFSYGDKKFIVTHGGIPCIPNSYIQTQQMIHGVGRYDDVEAVASAFYDNTDSDVYMVHGHRNVTNLPIEVNDRVFNLEGGVEFGGCLRSITITSNGIETKEVKNEVCGEFDYGEIDRTVPTSIEDAVQVLRSSKYIREKKNGNISSFNFTDEAFRRKSWTDATVKARGLFVNTETNKIVARGYEKFFNENERPETNFDMLKYKLSFPVKAYLKENGYLGLLGYDEETDELVFASKSTTTGPLAILFKDIFMNTVSNPDEVKEYLKSQNKCMVFEVISPDKDPHIIKYDKDHVVLLDVIDRELDFNVLPYNELQAIANKWCFKCKELVKVCNNWTEFYTWHSKVAKEDYTLNGTPIEGFVIEDQNGFMFKYKTAYYKNWKFMRGVSDSVTRCGYFRHTSALVTAEQNLFYGFLKKRYEAGLLNKENPSDIITLRTLFEEQSNNET